MKKKYYIIQAVFSLLTLGSCNSADIEEIAPISVAKVTAVPGAGFIDLKWALPDSADYKTLEVRYFDHLIKKNVVRLASVYADSMNIPNTRAKFGKYIFNIQPISETNTRGELLTIEAESGKAPKTKTWIAKGDAYKFTDGAITSNAAEPSEGPIKNLHDGDATTFFHSAWSVAVAGPHYLTFDMGEPVEAFMIETINRNNGGTGNRPKTVNILGSTDGVEFTVIKKLINLPNQASAVYESSGIIIEGDTYPRYIRYSVEECSAGGPAFNLAELAIFKGKITVIDPEVE
jgi:hypothetical protein